MSDNENFSDGDEDILGPEDLFNDEADEAEEDNDAKRSDDDRETKVKDEKDSEDKAEKKIKIKRIVKNPRVTLNFDTLRGPHGISALKKLFKNFKFKGTNHEEDDLTRIMGILQQWMSYQLCPSYNFESCMLQLEALGKKKVVQTYMKKVRMGMDDWGEVKSDTEDKVVNLNDSPMETDSKNDNFDLLLQEGLPIIDSENELEDETNLPQSDIIQSHITQEETEVTLTPEQLERIAMNKKLAEERRLKKISSQVEVTTETTESVSSEIPLEKTNLEENS